jgi:hypothetical protein
MTTIVPTLFQMMTASAKSGDRRVERVDGKCGYCRPEPALDSCYVAEDSTRVSEESYKVVELHSRW